MPKLLIIIGLLGALSCAARLDIMNHEFAFEEKRETRTTTESRVLFWTTQTRNAETTQLAAALHLVEIPSLSAAGRDLLRDTVYAGRSVADYAKMRFAEFTAEVSASAAASPAGYSYDEKTEAYLATPQFVIIRKLQWSYTGGAHGNYREVIFVLDIEAGKRLELEDVLRPEAASSLTSRLSAILRQKYNMQAEDNFFADIWPPTGFVFTDKGLEFRWDLYAIGPYVWGIPAAALPYEEIRPLLSAKGLEVLRALPDRK
ncbi:MAG: RsiV family protein [Candidatus Margulisbacteria bacterium]|jgi:hypothetical protein|nr:RsiV family protein [Candidatus Margulisiibacteriota bacterium]